jgi:ABC-type nitrate/sulfonate/bicarbonate transport system substrate-binding protein
VASGLFADYGLDVEILEPAPGPANVERVASGAVEFCLTSVSHFLRAQERRPLAARFVAVVVQRSPMAGFVSADSEFAEPGDLSRARLGGRADNELTMQYTAALKARGITPSPLVAIAYAEAPAALGRGAVDVVADYIDLLPRTRRQAGVRLRAIPVGPDAYSSGLVAGDAVAPDLVATMREAVAAALTRQREDPEWGVAALCDRYPDVDPVDAREGWALAEPNIFTGVPVGSMDEDRWRFTVDHLSGAYGIDAMPGDVVYRQEFLSVASN